MTAIEQKNFGPGYSSQDPLSSTISQQTSSLSLYEFAGLFLIIGSITIFSLFCSETKIGRKFAEKTGHFILICFRFKTSRGDGGVVGELAEGGDVGTELVESNLNGHSSDEEEEEEEGGTDAGVIEDVPHFVDEGTPASHDSGTTSVGRNS